MYIKRDETCQIKFSLRPYAVSFWFLSYMYLWRHNLCSYITFSPFLVSSFLFNFLRSPNTLNGCPYILLMLSNSFSTIRNNRPCSKFKTKYTENEVYKVMDPKWFYMFFSMASHRYISAGLKPVPEKSCKASYYRQFSTNID